MLRRVMIVVVLASAAGCSGQPAEPPAPQVIYVPVPTESSKGKPKKADPVGALSPIVPPPTR